MTVYTMMLKLMMKRSYKRKRKRGPVQSKKITHDNINFASGLERYMYMALKKAFYRRFTVGIEIT
jgi:hypothetical protein